MKASAVLLNWKRPWNLPKIVQHLQAVPLIDDITIFDNSGVLPDIDGARVIRSSVNRCTWGRFLAAREARHDVIATCDDDNLVKNFPQLYKAHRSRPEAITAALARWHYRHEAGKKPWILLGWGALFPKSALSCFDSWIERYGEDELLNRKADRIFGVLYGNHNPQKADFETLRNPGGGESCRDKASLWLKDDHKRLTNEAVKKALEIRNGVATPAIG